MSYGTLKFTHWPTHDQGRGEQYCSTAICRSYWLQYADHIGYTYRAAIFGNHGIARPNNSKKSPQNPLWFLSTGIVVYRPIRIWSKIQRKIVHCRRKWQSINDVEKKCLSNNFFTTKKNIWNFFLFVSIAKFLKVYEKIRKKSKKYFLTVKAAAKWPVITLCVLVILTASTVVPCYKIQIMQKLKHFHAKMSVATRIKQFCNSCQLLR